MPLVQTHPEPATLPVERLEAEITSLAADLWAATCRWLLLIAELDRREGWASWGARSCADWLSWRCGVGLGAAKGYVRVARALEDLPIIREEFASGRLSYSKVRALVRVATPETEDELVYTAQHATAADLERILRGLRRYGTLEDADEGHARRHLRYHWDDDGSLVLRGRLSPEDGALVVTALEQARLAGPEDDAERPEGVTAVTRSYADALVTMAETTLAHGPAPAAGHERTRVVVHLPQAEVEDGPGLVAETVQRLACDAERVEIRETRTGTPLDVGRRTRTIPTRLRRALHQRDRGCRFPGCTQRRFVDGHHVRHWSRGGGTDLDNLVLLCRHHHRRVHEGGFRIRLDHGEPRVWRPDGREVPTTPTSPSTTARLPATNESPAARSGKVPYSLCETIQALDDVFRVRAPVLRARRSSRRCSG